VGLLVHKRRGVAVGVAAVEKSNDAGHLCAMAEAWVELRRGAACRT
jgi:hypothetical protein